MNQAEQLATGTQPTIKNGSVIPINMPNLVEEYKQSKSYVEQYTTDFPQLDSLVDAVPINPDSDAPFVGDTTLAGLVRSIPRDSIQQLPVYAAQVNGTKASIPALICTYLLRKRVFNEDTFGKGLLSTLQIGMEQSLTHGYAPFMAALGSMYNDFGSTMKLLHHSDTSPEPGIQDANESGYHYVVAHLTPSRVRKILAQAKNNPTTSWDVAQLEKVLEGNPKPTDYTKSQSGPRQNATGEAMSPSYEFVTRYETGRGGTKVTFCPEYAEEPLRVLETHSKWGYPQVMYLVIDPAALTPFGISRVRLASPNQNLMNIYYGNIAAMLLLNSKPPVFQRGRFTAPIQLRQGAIWQSLDPNAEAKLQVLDNGSLQFFPEMSRQFAGQIQNIMGGRTVTVNGGQKGGFGKTAPGEKRAQDFEDSSSNQITKIAENFLRQYALVALDTLLSEQEGEDDLIVDDETKNSINQLEAGYVGDDNKVHMVWEEFYGQIEEWTVEILVSLSKDDLEEKRRGDLQDMAVMIGQNMDKLPPEIQGKLGPIVDSLLKDRAPLVAKEAPAAVAAPVSTEAAGGLPAQASTAPAQQ
jgi:hypothetical protein